MSTMIPVSSRMRRERKTIESMIRLYCRKNHKQGEGLCAECADLQEYTRARLQRCPFQAHKPTCARCPVHCYNAQRREQIRVVMRFAGPRMILHHPLMAFMHLMDGWKKTPNIGRK